MKLNPKVKRMTMTALMAAVIFVVTVLVKIPMPGVSGLGTLNLGDSVIYLTAALIGGPAGMIAAAIGSALADLLAGLAYYMLPTAIVKGLMGFVCGKLYARAARAAGLHPTVIEHDAAGAPRSTMAKHSAAERDTPGAPRTTVTERDAAETQPTVMKHDALAAQRPAVTERDAAESQRPTVMERSTAGPQRPTVTEREIFVRFLVASVVGGAIMVAGYALYDTMLLTLTVALTIVPFNLVQWGANVAVAAALYPVVPRIKKSLL